MDYVENNDNNNKILLLIILLIVISGAIGVLYYFFVFKCNSKDDECTSTSDCCDDLECINSICSSITPTVYQEPGVVVASGLTTCAEWDINNDCATGTTLTPSNVIGASHSECCVSALDCQGTWSACTSECEGADDRTFTQTQAHFGTGAECPEATDCQPGENDCPLNIDCEGAWSPCTAACEKGEERTFTVTTSQSGEGAACPTSSEAPDCQPGDGDCRYKWVYDPTGWGKDCDTICGSRQMLCEDGVWGIHDEEDMRQVFGEQIDYICDRRTYDIQHTGSLLAPYVTEREKLCRVKNMETSQGVPGQTTCSGGYNEYNRMCKCVTPTP